MKHLYIEVTAYLFNGGMREKQTTFDITVPSEGVAKEWLEKAHFSWSSRDVCWCSGFIGNGGDWVSLEARIKGETVFEMLLDNIRGLYE